MNMTLAEEARLRPAVMIAKPVWIEPAFEDPEAVLDLVHRSAPYPFYPRGCTRKMTTARTFHSSGYSGRIPARRGSKGPNPFSTMSALWRRHVGPSTPRSSSRARVMINLACPTGGSPPHRDLPYFRGCEKFPFWMLQCMGYSNRFHEWAVPIASTLSWFYAGEGGEFEYWPDGPDTPSVSVTTPLWNVGVVSDNEYMWHRVGPVGQESEWLKPGDIGRECQLHAVGADGWEIHDEGSVRAFRGDQVRLSILWTMPSRIRQRPTNTTTDLTTWIMTRSRSSLPTTCAAAAWHLHRPATR